MLEQPLPPCRLFVIMARNAPVAAIFRRGPSKWVQMVKWNTRDDTFEYGQWFKGRIYERRSDLSPDGSKLIYFASKFNARTLRDREYTYAWTAISKLSWLTALALWPKGDCWRGGGLFQSDIEVMLNHKPEQAQAHPQHQPQGLKVAPNPEASGEDDPIYSMRLTRDGWKVVQDWKLRYRGYPQLYITDQPERRELAHPWKRQHVVMTRSLDRLTYLEAFSVRDASSGQETKLEGADYAIWDQQGRLVVASQGQLQVGHLSEDGRLKLRVFQDLNPQRPQAMVSPAWAIRW